ncbi:redoxin domain-containing protein [Paraburkholderia sp. BCC1884]|uniref:redoxin domain-containing protein n=1 Tax=Paraburkholderia sp. BCC1884 TaxID=2562668 RepID=UPI001C918CCA|nr:redoxin domain-containing protein [Paraburkholderia sp. BCC1884]
MTTTQSSPTIPMLQVGMEAPDFTLLATPDQRMSLSELRGAPVIIAFYPADWSPVCGDELGLFNAALPTFHQSKAQLIAISVDSVWSHSAFSEQRKFHFPLLADFEPKGEVARRYGVYRSADGVCERALFVLDEHGIVRWAYVSPITVNPGVDGILSALEQINPSTKQETL